MVSDEFFHVDCDVVRLFGVRSDKHGSSVDKIAFADGTVLADVLTDGVLDRFLTDVRAARYVFSRSHHVLMAVVDLEGRIHDVDPDLVKTRRGQAFTLGFGMLLVGVPLSPLIVGIPMAARGWKAYTTSTRLRAVERGEKELRRFLRPQRPAITPDYWPLDLEARRQAA